AGQTAGKEAAGREPGTQAPRDEKLRHDAAASAIVVSLDEMLDMNDFQNPMMLKEFLGLLHDKLEKQGREVSFFVDQPSFREMNAEAPPLNDMQIQFSPQPKRMTCAAALKHALDQVPTGNATYLIRQGRVDILASHRAKLSSLLEQKITVRF